MGVVIRVVSLRDTELVTRVRGQTSDLAVSVSVSHAGRLEATLAEQLAAAERLAADRGARVVVWFRRLESGAEIAYVAEPARRTVFARRIRAMTKAQGGRSAQFEAVSLTVRSALQALAAGGHIGVTVPRPAPAPVKPAPVPRPVAPHAKPSPLRWTGSVGWQTVLDGLSPYGQQALATELGVKWRAGLVGVQLAEGFPLRLEDQLSSIDITRYSGGAYLGAEAALSRHFRLSAVAAAGVVALSRVTVALSPEVTPAPGRRIWSAYFGPQLTLGWHPFASSGAPALDLTGALDIVPGAPELGYGRSGQFVHAYTQHTIQPRVGLGLSFRAP